MWKEPEHQHISSRLTNLSWDRVENVTGHGFNEAGGSSVDDLGEGLEVSNEGNVSDKILTFFFT